jgi:hypothetical protein
MELSGVFVRTARQISIRIQVVFVAAVSAPNALQQLLTGEGTLKSNHEFDQQRSPRVFYAVFI